MLRLIFYGGITGGIPASLQKCDCCAVRAQWLVVCLWVLAEVAIAATDLAEIIGSATALNLLFGLPLWAGVLITAVDVLFIIVFGMKNFRLLEVCRPMLPNAGPYTCPWQLLHPLPAWQIPLEAPSLMQCCTEEDESGSVSRTGQCGVAAKHAICLLRAMGTHCAGLLCWISLHSRVCTLAHLCSRYARCLTLAAAQALVLLLCATIFACFVYELAAVKPSWVEVAKGFIPRSEIITDPGMLYTAIGIMGEGGLNLLALRPIPRHLQPDYSYYPLRDAVHRHRQSWRRGACSGLEEAGALMERSGADLHAVHAEPTYPVTTASSLQNEQPEALLLCMRLLISKGKAAWKRLSHSVAGRPGVVQPASWGACAGATVMPHNLYLHSSIIQTRAYPRTPRGKRMALAYGTWDSTLSPLRRLLHQRRHPHPVRAPPRSGPTLLLAGCAL